MKVADCLQDVLAGDASIQARSSQDRQIEEVVSIPGFSIGESATTGSHIEAPEGSYIHKDYLLAKESTFRFIQDYDAYRTLTGSGFFVSKDGLFLTANHCVVGGNKFFVKHDDVKAEAKVLGVDKDHDIALLKVDLDKFGHEFNPVILGDSNHLKHGAGLVVTGFPLTWNELYVSPGKFLTQPKVSVTYDEAAFEKEYNKMIYDVFSGSMLTQSMNEFALDTANLGFIQSHKDMYRYNFVKPEVFLQAEMHAEHGQSGSPCFDEKGKVVAMLDGTAKDKIDNESNLVKVEYIKALIASVKAQHKH